LPANSAVCRDLLELYVLEKGVIELGSELAHRPDWVPVPLTGLVDLLEGA
jgi:maltose alpha-D-glucosyltransferase/alpha-amylase